MIRISNCEDRDAPANLDRTITISGRFFLQYMQCTVHYMQGTVQYMQGTLQYMQGTI